MFEQVFLSSLVIFTTIMINFLCVCLFIICEYSHILVMLSNYSISCRKLSLEENLFLLTCVSIELKSVQRYDWVPKISYQNGGKMYLSFHRPGIFCKKRTPTVIGSPQRAMIQENEVENPPKSNPSSKSMQT